MATQATGDQHLDKGATLALLIDGDNASPKIVAGLLAEVAKYGVAGVRRIYGDWTKPNLGGWKDCLLEHSIQPIQQFAYTTGKNATDGAMIIDAMDLLYTARFDGFCIVSSDSDFARLAARVREQGVAVYGFGERKTPRPFVTACDKFVYFDVLNAPGGGASATPAGRCASPATAPGPRDCARPGSSIFPTTPGSGRPAGPGSTSTWPAIAPSRKACRWCAARRRGSRR